MAHDVIVAFVLPNRTRTVEQLVDRVSREGLPRMQNLIERSFFLWGDHRMHVIGHHHP